MALELQALTDEGKCPHCRAHMPFPFGRSNGAPEWHDCTYAQKAAVFNAHVLRGVKEYVEKQRPASTG